MITANELRIGNIVRYTNKEILRPSAHGNIRHITVRDLSDLEKYGGLFEPVPLTPEILEKCPELIKDNYGVYFFGETDICCKLTNATLEVGVWSYENDEGEMPVICELKYLHQLQNCFQVVTQTELTVNI